MSPQYDNNMRGVIFDNSSKKGDNEKAPDWKGHCEVNGVQYWLSGWWKQKRGSDEYFMQLSIQPKDQQQQQQPGPAQGASGPPTGPPMAPVQYGQQPAPPTAGYQAPPTEGSYGQPSTKHQPPPETSPPVNTNAAYEQAQAEGGDMKIPF